MDLIKILTLSTYKKYIVKMCAQKFLIDIRVVRNLEYNIIYYQGFCNSKTKKTKNTFVKN